MSLWLHVHERVWHMLAWAYTHSQKGATDIQPYLLLPEARLHADQQQELGSKVTAKVIRTA